MERAPSSTSSDRGLKNVNEDPLGSVHLQTAAEAPLDPAFVGFISQLMKFSKALYGDVGTDPNLRYTLRPQPTERIDEFDITVNGEATQLKGGASHDFLWRPARIPAVSRSR